MISNQDSTKVPSPAYNLTLMLADWMFTDRNDGL